MGNVQLHQGSMCLSLKNAWIVKGYTYIKFSEFVQSIIWNFLIIFASILFIIAILRQRYYPNIAFDLKSIYIIIAFSFLSALMGFILYSPNEISEKKMRIKIAIHLFTSKS